MVGKDIAEALGYKETANMRKLLDAYDYKEIDPQSSEFTGFVQNGSTLEPNKSRG
jgi:prophage antirepressor-like protein